MMSARSAEFVVRSCAAPPPPFTTRQAVENSFFSSGVTRGRFVRHISIKRIFVRGNEARQWDYGRRSGNCIGRGEFRRLSCVRSGGNEARQWRLRTPRLELHWPWWVRKLFCVQSGETVEHFFSSVVTRGRFDRHISLNHNFAGGMRRVNATTDAAVGTALAVVG